MDRACLLVDLPSFTSLLTNFALNEVGKNFQTISHDNISLSALAADLNNSFAHEAHVLLRWLRRLQLNQGELTLVMAVIILLNQCA